MISRKILFLVTIACLSGVVSASPGYHAPFTEADWPKTFPLHKLEVNVISDEAVRIQVADSAKTEIRLSGVPGEAVFAELVSGGRVQFPKREISPLGMFWLAEAYTSDLNQDGQPDYVIAYSCGGNGGNAALSLVTFLLSTGQGYALFCTESYEFGPLDFISVEGKPRFINVCLRPVEECRDGKQHNFWVYNLYAFDQGTLKVDNKKMPGFPKVVWFTYAPNHQETTLLTSKRKAALIKSAQ
ncbi:MAG: hypothetical protein MUC65_05680 [Pontiellaceae bacterium]|jgi:hypothetical protein|nr:hypothetical protein [Pontiellaceae bacterium]